MALDLEDTSMTWGSIGVKAHPRKRLDALMSQWPMRSTSGMTPTAVGAMIFAGVVAVGRADDPETPSISWTARFRDSYLVISLATCEVMAIVILVFVLTVAFPVLCCWSYTCMRRRPGAVQPAQARLGATAAQADIDSHSSAASAARNYEEGLRRDTGSA